MLLSLIPESAPFNTEQRAWLNGFLAGWLGLQEGHSEIPTPSSPAIVPPESNPWHDPALPIADRMKLAENGTLPDRLMATMAQLDCGACGYVCRTYSQAIASGEERSLTLCSPGGSETSKALKKLMSKEKPTSNGVASVTSGANGAPSGWSRKNPYSAPILSTLKLNKPGSEKETHHVEIDISSSGLKYKVGDALGVFPTNCDELVSDIIQTIGATGDKLVSSPSKMLRAALTHDVCLTEITEDFLRLCADSATNAQDRDTILELLENDEPIAGDDVLEVLRMFSSVRIKADAFVQSLAPMKPRLYSISSSPARHAGQVHLTVARVAYAAKGRVRKGVASTMFADRVRPGASTRVFIHPSHGFTLPADSDAPMIMIGPGTGIAPFRAFLHERDAAGAKGKNWLFFGDQRSSCDFLYQQELEDFRDRGVLTYLDTAFSREQEEKIYVQHRLIERGQELFQWLEDGAYLFVCGDARRMAVDVDNALTKVIGKHGRFDDAAARAYVQNLSANGRYVRDVY